jgi:hypothetical protein
MSQRAKATFLAAVSFTSITIVTVFYLKDRDFANRRVGIERDIQTRSRRRLENELEQDRQLELQKALEKQENTKK